MKKGYTIPELIIVMAVVGVIFFIGINQVSYAFNVDYDTELYDQTLASIEKCAVIYAENNKNIFTDSNSNSVYMTVEQLAKEDIIYSNSYGVVNDPRDNEKTLNSLNVKITLKDDKVSAEVLVG